MLALLHELQGIDFIRQLKKITERHEFSPIASDPQIFIVGGDVGDDYIPLLNAARKAVEQGKKQLSVTQKSLEDDNFIRAFIRRYVK